MFIGGYTSAATPNLDCVDLCDTWVKDCEKIARTARNCNQSVSNQARSLALAICRTYPQGEVADCISAARAEWDVFKAVE